MYHETGTRSALKYLAVGAGGLALAAIGVLAKYVTAPIDTVSLPLPMASTHRSTDALVQTNSTKPPPPPTQPMWEGITFDELERRLAELAKVGREQGPKAAFELLEQRRRQGAEPIYSTMLARRLVIESPKQLAKILACFDSTNTRLGVIFDTIPYALRNKPDETIEAAAALVDEERFAAGRTCIEELATQGRFEAAFELLPLTAGNWRWEALSVIGKRCFRDPDMVIKLSNRFNLANEKRDFLESACSAAALSGDDIGLRAMLPHFRDEQIRRMAIQTIVNRLVRRKDFREVESFIGTLEGEEKRIGNERLESARNPPKLRTKKNLFQGAASF